MANDEHHRHLIKELAEQFEPLFNNSSQGIYLYLDDFHKICNQQFADMLGYGSIEDWTGNEFPVGDVLEEDQEKVIRTYKEASEKFIASSLNARFVRKDGQKIKANILMAPITYKGEVFVIHFISGE